ncbi:hypothetical protein [Aneurinibacillus tyrosinisolvens]|uniref:hypothetical protein n=1 Tax=Aneurinibacillus tyrosinisolvens TaxID=1443435 RepID=UPI00063EDBAA|nr:hypothetical protein [Aneurinibacillus tyrosinisolvens]
MVNGENGNAPGKGKEREKMMFIEDVAEGMDRMLDDGGGVVDESVTYETPVLRNLLVEDDEK